MYIAVCDCRIPDVCKEKLLSHNISTIKLPLSDTLEKPIAAHPDMLLLPIGKKIFVSRKYFEKAETALSDISTLTNMTLMLTDDIPKSPYPYDIAFNGIQIGKYFFCLAPYISKDALGFSKELGLEIVSVKQGYTKCNICKVSEKALITSDPSIEKAAKKLGIEVLKISSGNISLPGYDFGFIGGASGETDKNVFFCGDLSCHPDGERISAFCQKQGKHPVSLSNKPLLDVGTIFFFPCK